MVTALHMKKLAEIWLQLHWFVHHEIVYFLLYYTLYSHIFSLKVRISDSQVSSEGELMEDKVILIEAQYKKNPLVILTLKKHNHLQYISKGNI